MAEKGSHTVLVVDDDPGHRGMLEALLGRWGLAVTSAGDGKEAVARVCERPFDVVLMDIRMPDMDGITALKEIRKYNPAVPVVLMTAYSAVESAVEAMKSGAVDYLIKPLDFDQLKSTLFQNAGTQRGRPVRRAFSRSSGGHRGKQPRRPEDVGDDPHCGPFGGDGVDQRQVRDGQGAGGAGHP